MDQRQRFSLGPFAMDRGHPGVSLRSIGAGEVGRYNP
jgi:hypothetical protein